MVNGPGCVIISLLVLFFRFFSFRFVNNIQNANDCKFIHVFVTWLIILQTIFLCHCTHRYDATRCLWMLLKRQSHRSFMCHTAERSRVSCKSIFIWFYVCSTLVCGCEHNELVFRTTFKSTKFHDNTIVVVVAVDKLPHIKLHIQIMYTTE